MAIETDASLRMTSSRPFRAIPVMACVALTLGSSFDLARADGDPARGELVYQGCEDCHSIDSNDVGPRHRGVVGRMAGTVPGYAYSPALKSSGIVWTEANLDKWLQDPQALVPGTRMVFSLSAAQDRADVIAFLKQRAR